MPRRKGRGKHRKGRSRHSGYRNTVTINYDTAAAAPVFVTASELYNLPNRNIVPTFVNIQIMPTLSGSGAGPNSAVMKFQPSLNARVDSTTFGKSIPFGTYRNLSNINPSYYKCSINRLARMVPYCRVAIPGDSNDSLEWSIELNILPRNLEGREVELILTGFCIVMPQELLNIVSITAHKSLAAIPEEDDEEDYDYIPSASAASNVEPRSKPPQRASQVTPRGPPRKT